MKECKAGEPDENGDFVCTCEKVCECGALEETDPVTQRCEDCCEGNYCAYGCGTCFCPCHD